VRRAVLMAGPTASGKSALALGLAERLGGMVINADSMQVYREFRILTARPGLTEEARAPHRLFGHVPVSEAYSVGCWLADVAGVLAAAKNADLLPIIVGGTGLYFRALMRGLPEIPPVPAAIRSHWRERAEEGATALHAELSRRDPVMAARIRPSDPQRIARALEVLDATGRSLSHWQAGISASLLPPYTPRFVLDLPRHELYARIDTRARAMVDSGAVEEVRQVLSLGLAPSLPALKALGMRELGAVAEGRVTLGDGLSAFQAATRRYAKRQTTWFRHQMSDWSRLSASDPQAALSIILAAVDQLRR
jgi:tRNA dimethylallyltransferase